MHMSSQPEQQNQVIISDALIERYNKQIRNAMLMLVIGLGLFVIALFTISPNNAMGVIFTFGFLPAMFIVIVVRIIQRNQLIENTNSQPQIGDASNQA